jgi:predicted anti-sigma-YlaC factor YlaD
MAGQGDYACVGCEECREALSARLDGEDDPAERSSVDAHVAACEACARWVDDAAAVTRLVRMSLVPEPAPSDLSETVVAAMAPARARRRLAYGLRILLGALGAAQFLLGVAQLSLMSAELHEHSVGASPAHLWHESAAWNIAVGAAFGWIAVRRIRPAGLLTLLSVFVGMLALVSLNDLWFGGVDAQRLLSHGFVIAGYLVILAMSRPALDFTDPSSGSRSSVGWRARFDQASEPSTPPNLRLVTHARPVPAVRYDRAA